MIIKKLVSVITAIITLAGLFSHGGVWLLEDIPEYGSGAYSSALYDTGSGRENDWKGRNDNNSFMQGIKYTDKKNFDAYCEKLESEGYTKTFENSIEDNYYRGYSNGTKQIYTYYNDSLREARVTDDSCSDALDAFGYEYDPGAASEIYQYNFHFYDKNIKSDEELYARNGMMFIIKLADNKLVIIDGGAIKQSADENIEKFSSFIHEITGKGYDEKIDIAMWYGTHPHSDHISFFYKYLNLRAQEVNLERAMFNYQAYNNVEYDHRADYFRDLINEKFPEAKYIKCRSGYRFNLANLGFEVLYTHEDYVNVKDGSFKATDANDASSVLKITNAGKTFLFLGDSDMIVQKEMLKRFSSKTLHCDVMQGAHHMLNYLPLLYAEVRPCYVFASQSEERTTKTLASYYTLLKFTPRSHFLFADKGIYSVIPENGKLTVNCRPFDSVPFDGSDV